MSDVIKTADDLLDRFKGTRKNISSMTYFACGGTSPASKPRWRS